MGRITVGQTVEVLAGEDAGARGKVVAVTGDRVVVALPDGDLSTTASNLLAMGAVDNPKFDVGQPVRWKREPMGEYEVIRYLRECEYEVAVPSLYETSAACPYCSKTVSMSAGQLGDDHSDPEWRDLVPAANVALKKAGL